MEAKKKGTASIIDVIKLPVAALLVLTVLDELLMEDILSWIFTIASLLVIVYIGWSAVKQYRFTLGRAALAGALAGLILEVIYIAGMAALGQSILEYYGVSPVEYGVPPEGELVSTVITVAVSTAILVILCAILAAIGGFAAGKVGK